MNDETSSQPSSVGQPYSMRGQQTVNDRFASFAQTKVLTVRRRPVITADMAIFTMGSCFAEEIRRSLSERGFRCLPNYRNVHFDQETTKIDELPDREHMNFYNSFSVRLQIEQLLGLWEQPATDYWTIGRLSPKIVRWRDGPNYQDPYKRLVIARSPDILRNAVRGIVEEMRAAFFAADAFIFTLGMTEVFLSKTTGQAANQKPAYAGGGGADETDRHDSSFEENLLNVRRTIDLVRRHKPDAPIVLSVSPVPLARTFAHEDVVVRNAESKAILRAVIGQVVREYDRVLYLPSFEYVSAIGAAAYRDDLRHVRREVVEDIISAFYEAFVA